MQGNYVFVYLVSFLEEVIQALSAECPLRQLLAMALEQTGKGRCEIGHCYEDVLVMLRIEIYAICSLELQVGVMACWLTKSAVYRLET